MGQISEVKVPDIGDYTNVPVIEVLVKPGDTVGKDQGLVTLESDKATMEVPASIAGVVKDVKVKVGDEISEGTVVALIEAGEAAAAAPAKADAPAKSAAEKSAARSASSPAPLAEAAAARSAAGEGGASTQAAVPGASSDRHPASPSPQPSPAGGRGGESASATESAPRSPPVNFGAETVMPDKVPYASPSVRLFARELGVDLSKVGGSGRKNRITKEDVQNFVKQSLAAPRAPAAGAGGAGLNLLPWPQVDFSKFGEVETKPLSKIRKISGANLARNWVMIPHVTQHDEADITELEALRVTLNKEHEKAGIKFTMLGFIVKAVVVALKKYPDFNASLDASGESLVLKKYYNVGFAADTPNGLVVPVLKNADRKGIVEIAQETTALAGKAREGKLGPADMSGGCFSISSLGGIGGVAFTPIVNAPEVAILGVSKSAMKPVWDGKAFVPRLMLPLSLSYDHRVIDGASAARFAAYLATLLGDMRRSLL